MPLNCETEPFLYRNVYYDLCKETGYLYKLGKHVANITFFPDSKWGLFKITPKTDPVVTETYQPLVKINTPQIKIKQPVIKIRV